MTILKTTAALAALITLSACASFSSAFRQSASTLPIDAVSTSAGQFITFRAHETTDRLYVSGTAKEHPLADRTHVDIQLLDPTGHVVAERQDDIDPAHAANGGGPRYQAAFVASFPLSEARQSSRIRITYHNASHACS